MGIYPNTKTQEKKLTQLSGDGKTVEVGLVSGERIYSRKDTSKIVSMALSAKNDTDLSKLGKFVYEATKLQDNRKPEYTND